MKRRCYAGIPQQLSQKPPGEKNPQRTQEIGIQPVYGGMKRRLDTLVRKVAAVTLTVIAAGFVYEKSLAPMLSRASEMARAARAAAYVEASRFAKAAESPRREGIAAEKQPELSTGEDSRFHWDRFANSEAERLRAAAPGRRGGQRGVRFRVLVR